MSWTASCLLLPLETSRETTSFSAQIGGVPAWFSGVRPLANSRATMRDLTRPPSFFLWKSFVEITLSPSGRSDFFLHSMTSNSSICFLYLLST